MCLQLTHSRTHTHTHTHIHENTHTQTHAWQLQEVYTKRQQLVRDQGVSLDLEIDAVLRAMGNFRIANNVADIVSCYKHRSWNVR